MASVKRSGVWSCYWYPDSAIGVSDLLTSQHGSADMPLASQHLPRVLFLLPFSVDPTPDSQGRQGWQLKPCDSSCLPPSHT